ncbi:MAG: hypothetical protein U0638_10355 [Phycisphaerales bacterium]
MKMIIGSVCVVGILATISGCSKPWSGEWGPREASASSWSNMVYSAAPSGDLFPLVRRVYSGARGNSLVHAMIVPDPSNSAMFSLEEVTYAGSPGAGVNLKRGYAYLIGRWPIVIVKGGSGAGEGTKIAARVIPGTAAPNHTRFFLINPVAGQKLVVLVEKGEGNPPERYELMREGCIEISDEDADGVGKYESTTERRGVDGAIVWDSVIEEEYQTLAQNAAEARLDF